MNTGIYCIYFDNTNMVYIGKSSNIEDRWKRHLRELKNNCHHSYKLQRYYNLGNIPRLEILEITTTDLEIKEIQYINEFNSFYDGFNCTTGISTTGVGYEHPCARYSRQDYINILKELCYTNKELYVISQELNIDLNIINNISCMRTHSWLEQEFPIEYGILELKSSIMRPRGNISDSIEKAFLLYIDLGLNVEDILIISGISKKQFQHIIYKSSYTWLSIKYPTKYKILDNLHKKYVKNTHTN